MKKITTLLVLLTLSLTTNLATFAAKAVNIDEQKNFGFFRGDDACIVSVFFCFSILITYFIPINQF